jgi:hypothetical protein
MRRNTNKSFILKNILLYLKLIFQVLCFIILIYQFIDITNLYLNFPYDVKFDVKDYKGLDLPSVTFCLEKDNLWSKTNFKGRVKIT